MERYKTTLHLEEAQALAIFLNKFQVNLESVCVELNKTESKSESFEHLFMFIERMMWGWRDINTLLESSIDNMQSCFTIPVIARAIINDCILIQYLDSKYDLNENMDILDDTDFLDVCRNLDSDFLAAWFEIYSHLDEPNKSKEQIEKVISTHPQIFDSNGKFKYKRLNITNAIKEIMLNRKPHTGIGINIKFSKMSFKYLSQFEHCSPYTKQHLYGDSRGRYENIMITLLISLSCTNVILHRINYRNTPGARIRELSRELLNFLNEYNKEHHPNPANNG